MSLILNLNHRLGIVIMWSNDSNFDLHFRHTPNLTIYKYFSTLWLASLLWSPPVQWLLSLRLVIEENGSAECYQHNTHWLTPALQERSLFALWLVYPGLLVKGRWSLDVNIETGKLQPGLGSLHLNHSAEKLCRACILIKHIGALVVCQKREMISCSILVSG